MQSALATLLTKLDEPILETSNVIQWGSPVLSFGDLSIARVATLGLNPSNREFVDTTGKELEGSARRFHTLKSLGLNRWSDANDQHLKLITDSCRSYFSRNPYDGWFKGLDQIISGTNASYYSGSQAACHLDLIPYATTCKWGDLEPQQRLSLLHLAGDTLGLLLRDSPVQMLVLNGKSVVQNFEKLTLTKLDQQAIPEWDLPRKSGPDVVGYSYTGMIKEIAGVMLPREIMVLGYNHNIQSSFGVTTRVKSEIRNWIAKSATKVFSRET